MSKFTTMEAIILENSRLKGELQDLKNNSNKMNSELNGLQSNSFHTPTSSLKMPRLEVRQRSLSLNNPISNVSSKRKRKKKSVNQFVNYQLQRQSSSPFFNFSSNDPKNKSNFLGQIENQINNKTYYEDHLKRRSIPNLEKNRRVETLKESHNSKKGENVREEKFSKLYIKLKEQLDKKEIRNSLLQQELYNQKTKNMVLQKDLKSKDQKLQKIIVENIKLSERLEKNNIIRKEKDNKILSEYLEKEKEKFLKEKEQTKEEIINFKLEKEKFRNTMQKFQLKIKNLEMEKSKIKQKLMKTEIERDEYEFELNKSNEAVLSLEKDCKKKKEKLRLLELRMEKNERIVQQFKELSKTKEFKDMFSKIIEGKND